MGNQLKDIGINILKKEILNLNFKDENYIFIIILLYDDFEENEKKKYLKNIKKVLELLFENFDEDYLLLKSNNKFDATKNILFLELFEDLIEILEFINLNKQIDKLIDIKLKIELGVQRYLLFNKKSLIVNFNLEDKSFKIINDKNIKNLSDNKEILTYNLSKKYLNEKFKLDILQNKKVSEDLEIKNSLKSFQKYFPNFIFKDNNLEKLKIRKSLFLEYDTNFLELKKFNIILKDINSTIIVILILTILKNE